MKEAKPVSSALASTDQVLDEDDILAFDISDEALEDAAGMEGGPHKTGCTSYCPAYSC